LLQRQGQLVTREDTPSTEAVEIDGRQLARTDGMRRPVSERDAVRSQVIDALEAQETKETGNEEE